VTDARGRGPRTVLVTGAAGFVGSALCRRLDALGHRVVGYDNLSRGRREYLPEGVHLVEGDIRDRERFASLVADSRPDWLVHLAAMHFIPECIARPAETMEVNAEGTRRVLDACRGSAVSSVVVASSAAVYAPVDGPCLEGSTPLAPLEVYGESKVAAEELAQSFFGDTGVPTTVLRLFNAIGRHETNPHVLPHILSSLRTSNDVELGNTAPRRDYVDTRDIAEAIVTASASAVGLRTFNVGTGEAHSVDDVVAALRRLLGAPIRIVRDPSRVRATERMLLLADIGRIRTETGWSPRIGLEETLADLLDEFELRSRDA
jgi:UDP-glucose 4-epimerase